MKIRFTVAPPPAPLALKQSWAEYEDLPWIGPPLDVLYDDDDVVDDPYAGIDDGDHGNH